MVQHSEAVKSGKAELHVVLVVMVVVLLALALLLHEHLLLLLGEHHHLSVEPGLVCEDEAHQGGGLLGNEGVDLCTDNLHQG